jgi:hypothetical protein
LSADIWSQPALNALPSATGLRTGGLLAATMHVALGTQQASSRMGLVGEFGYKSDGFVRGELLRAGAIARFGLTVVLDGAH